MKEEDFRNLSKDEALFLENKNISMLIESSQKEALKIQERLVSEDEILDILSKYEKFVIKMKELFASEIRFIDNFRH